MITFTINNSNKFHLLNETFAAFAKRYETWALFANCSLRKYVIAQIVDGTIALSLLV